MSSEDHPQTKQDYINRCKEANSAFFKAYGSRVFVQYVREADRRYSIGFGYKGRPTAIFVARENEDGTISTGWSAGFMGRFAPNGTVIDKPDVFYKVVALQKAIQRLESPGLKTGTMPHRLANSKRHLNYSDFLANAEREFAFQKLNPALMTAS